MKISSTLDNLYQKKNYKHPPKHITHMKCEEHRNKFNTLQSVSVNSCIMTEYKNNTKGLWKHTPDSCYIVIKCIGCGTFGELSLAL